MEAMLLLLIIGPVAALFILADFFYFLTKGRRDKFLSQPLWALFAAVIPVGMLVFEELFSGNTCCSGWTLMSPKHSLSVYALIFICACVYFYCTLRVRTAPPLMEVVVNCILLSGIALNVAMGIQNKGGIAWMLLTPADLLLIMTLIQNHQRLVKEMEEDSIGLVSDNWAVKAAWYLLRWPSIAKFPVLLLLCCPILVIISSLLFLFGQRPDSFIKAFTDTYNQGLSRLDIDCNQVVCGGHFLCTIAAKGHRELVKPLRAGVRAGAPIKCNRQLLISNAFEEWLEQHVAWLHRPVRRLYNHVGSFLHRHYGVFDRKWVSDMVYLLMKPLEWLFLVTLYVVDRHPETRIAQQYMSRGDREDIAAGRQRVGAGRQHIDPSGQL